MALFKDKFVVVEIDAQTWLIEEHYIGTPCYCYLLEGENSALLIDSGIGGDDLSKVTSTLTTKPITVAATHGHFDHVGGNAYFKDTWVHPDDFQVMALQQNPAYIIALLKYQSKWFIKPFVAPFVKAALKPKPLPEPKPLKDGQVFDLGDRHVEVIVTPGHSTGSLCFLDKERKILYTGDMVCTMGILLNLCGSTDVKTYRDSMEKLLERKGEFTTLYAGHHQRPIEPVYIERYLACANSILDNSGIKEEMGHGSWVVNYQDIRIEIPKNPRMCELPKPGQLPYIGE